MLRTASHYTISYFASSRRSSLLCAGMQASKLLVLLASGGQGGDCGRRIVNNLTLTTNAGGAAETGIRMSHPFIRPSSPPETTIST